jgi:hypothetical protein
MFTNTNNNIFKMSKKLIITLSICLAFVLNSNAQNQLTFNQVLLVTLTSQGDTVPQGKVWKVESAVSDLPVAVSQGGTSGTITSEIFYYINNFKSVLNKNSYMYNSGSAQYTNTANPFPMWLPAGTIVSSGDLVSALSIIEFNIE